MEPEELLEFPCRFPIKVMGLAEADIQGLVLEVLRNHKSAPHPDDVTYRHSGQGKYISVTAVIYATSRAQLEAIYQDLKQDERVRYLL